MYSVAIGLDFLKNNILLKVTHVITSNVMPLKYSVLHNKELTYPICHVDTVLPIMVIVATYS